MRALRRRLSWIASLLVLGALVAPTAQAAGQAADPRLAEVIGYYTGAIGQVDDPRAHELLIEVAGAGDVLARMWLARCYSRGRMLFDRDEARARELAAEVIDQVAEALGVDADHGLAIAWYHRAADLGNVLAQHNLGNAYREGDGVTRDAGMAVYWYRQAALQGDALPAFWLGEMYERGEGVSQSREEALRWYRESAARGNTRAVEALAQLQAR